MHYYYLPKWNQFATKGLFQSFHVNVHLAYV